MRLLWENEKGEINILEYIKKKMCIHDMHNKTYTSGRTQTFFSNPVKPSFRKVGENYHLVIFQDKKLTFSSVRSIQTGNFTTSIHISVSLNWIFMSWIRMVCCYISISYRSVDIEWIQHIFIFFFPTAKLIFVNQ